MFPNVRLMIVAILAAIAGIGCGLGLFATFRVNHEPLARLAEASPPLQLAVDNLALGSQARMPLQARLPVSGAGNVISVPAIIPTPSPAPIPAVERAEADSASAGDSNIQQTAVGANAVAEGNATSLAVSVPAEQSSVTSDASAPSQQEPAAAAADQQPAAAAQDRQPPAVAQDQQPGTVATTAASAAETAAINAAAEDQQPATKPAQSVESKAPKPGVTATRAAPVRHAARKIRARRTAATIAAQPAYQYSQPTYSQPNYTWADGAAQASQPIKRVQIKRHRTAKKAAPAAQSNPAAATAGLGGTQY